ncbi:MAG: hypothetical protein AAGA75_01505 [Cyanobacteria bacterium P01_E01_bin.6]
MTLLDQLHSNFFTPTPQSMTAKTAVWWGFSVSIPLIFGLLALHDAFHAQRIVQDDARQYLFWMQRFQQAELFPNDLIADYFQSVTPLGYKILYRAGALLGIEPFTFNKLLPIGLGIITTGYFFWVVMAMFPLPITAFLASLLLNQTLWMKDDLVSATPRAFIYPFFVAFLYYLIQYRDAVSTDYPATTTRVSQWRGWQPLVMGTSAIALLGLFYPQYVLVAGGVVMLSLVRWKQGRPMVSRMPSDWLCARAYLITIASVVAFYGLTASAYDPIVTLEQAKTMPEFWPGGRNFFFSDNLWWFYGVGDRSGFLHVGLVRPATLAVGIFLPLLLWRSPHHSVLQHCRSPLAMLIRLLLSATGLFIGAHVLLFRLHLPSRYTDHSLRIIMAIAAALVITVILESLIRPRLQLSSIKLGQRRNRGHSHNSQRLLPMLSWQRLSKLVVALLLSILIVIYPVFVENFPLTKYKQGRVPKLYDFFKAQPTDILIASVAEDVNNIPVFAQRSILVGREYAIPYHLGFYRVFRDRAIDLLRAQYSPDPTVAIAVIQSYGIDYWILDNKAYDPDYLEDNWTRQYLSDIEDVTPRFSTSEPPALVHSIPLCTVTQQHQLTVLDAQCLQEQLTAANLPSIQAY